jgi:hypothetical protein
MMCLPMPQLLTPFLQALRQAQVLGRRTRKGLEPRATGPPFGARAEVSRQADRTLASVLAHVRLRALRIAPPYNA